MSAMVERYQQGPAALVVNRAWCKGCDLCVRACPSGILALDTIQRVYVKEIAKCIFCGICAVRCPDFVFVLERPSDEAVGAEAGLNGEPVCD